MLPGAQWDREENKDGMPHACVSNELNWLHSTKAKIVLTQVENLLVECTKRFYTGTENMLQNSYSLNSCQGTDLITSTVYLSPNLLGITKAEIIVKYSKPLVTYKGIATPEVAWNFQQLLDSANFLSSTLHSLQKGAKIYDELTRLSKSNNDTAHLLLLENFKTVKKGIKHIINSLNMPRKRPVSDLIKLQLNFSPVPNDLLISYYISTNRLVCSVYHFPTQNSNQIDSIYHADCELVRLSEVINLLNLAYSLAQEFISNTLLLNPELNFSSNN